MKKGRQREVMSFECNLDDPSDTALFNHICDVWPRDGWGYAISPDGMAWSLSQKNPVGHVGPKPAR